MDYCENNLQGKIYKRMNCRKESHVRTLREHIIYEFYEFWSYNYVLVMGRGHVNDDSLLSITLYVAELII